MIEDIAPPARLAGTACKLAVDGVEESHDPGRQQAPAVVTGPEQPHGHENQHQAGRSDLVRRDSVVGAPPRHRPRRGGPGVQSDHICDALVGTREDALLDSGEFGFRQRHQVRWLALAQHVVVTVGQLRRRHKASAGWRAPVGQHRRRLGCRHRRSRQAQGDDAPIGRGQCQVFIGRGEAAHEGIVVDPVGAHQHPSFRVVRIGSGLRARELPLQPLGRGETPQTQRRLTDDDADRTALWCWRGAQEPSPLPAGENSFGIIGG